MLARHLWSFLPSHVLETLFTPETDQVDNLLMRCSAELRALTIEMGVDQREVHRQVRLHLPAFELRELASSHLPDELMETVRGSVVDYLREWSIYEDGVNLAGFGATRVSRRPEHGYAFDQVPARYEPVPADDARWLEMELHYMRHFREDATLRLGMYAGEPATLPLAYASCVTCERAYLHDALAKVVGEYDASRVCHVVRAYGYSHLPADTMSAFYSLVDRSCEDAGFNYLVTAVNPYLQFDGRSVLASGFHPFASVPVKYYYDDCGRYRTRRGSRGARSSRWRGPNNILFVKGVSKKARRVAEGIQDVVIVTDDQYEGM